MNITSAFNKWWGHPPPQSSSASPVVSSPPSHSDFIVVSNPLENSISDLESLGIEPPFVPGEVDSPSRTTVTQLMEKFTAAWKVETASFEFTDSPFDVREFTEKLTRHTKQFKREKVARENYFGYIEKFDLDPSLSPKIYVRADLHGDLKSLIENVRSLKEEGLLDGNFKCQPGVHLVFFRRLL